jgi:lauroyl/myristoyl acyltransferase
VRPLATGYHLAARLARALPPQARYPLAQIGGSVWFHASRAQQRNALRNYGVVLGRLPEDPVVQRTARLAFENYGQMLADFVLLGSLGRDELLARVTYDGLEHVEEAMAGGRGCILAVPHMGSWDMAGAGGAALGFPVGAVAERFPGSLDEAVVSNRQGFGMKVIPLGRSAVRQVREVLEANGVLALLCDLPQGRGGVEVSFFDRLSRVPAGPAAFARRTGAAIVPACCYRVSPGSYHVHVEPPLDVPAGGEERAAQAAVMQGIIGRFEEFIRERPDQWYAFKPMFA